MTEFGKTQLFKYGWTEGKGLGKNENGITKALKSKLKLNTFGFGYSNTEFQRWNFKNSFYIMINPKNLFGIRKIW
ncbi:PREDICTED: G patch domain-containing protein 4 [Ceratosolen solmsi marchali]|uniref:G patch domain-containing protein 4 n=1 Tax=Ceratosolen solmsi marchali TaxID=326594 RepID=A0AAJ6YFU1_9HYME|nr:PREDICTED: G patch domain-containing protein 4 [Ceratosolen solmsi marchali]